MVVKRYGFKRSHLLRLGDTRYPGNNDVGQADRALCGVWIGYAYSAGFAGIEIGDFVRIATDVDLATCPGCRAARRSRKR